MRVEGFTPPAEIVAQIERIAQRVSLDVGGIEFLVDDRDGKHYFYDINALSNFVADAVNVVGFDPHARLVDYLERRLASRDAVKPAKSAQAARNGRRASSADAVDRRPPVGDAAEHHVGA